MRQAPPRPVSFYYTKNGYAMMARPSATTGHWFGGEPRHRRAKCPACRKPLLLLADLDCARLRKLDDAKLFRSMRRLPLYYCWRCCAEKLSYQVVDSRHVRILGGEGDDQGPEFPYRDFPDAFPRTPVALVPIPYRAARLLAVYQEVDRNWLSEDDKKTMHRHLARLRHPGFSRHDVNRHQIGGLLNLVQGHESVGCPNRRCEAHKSHKAGYAARMRELAVICDDPHPGLPMATAPGSDSRGNEWVQVVYWVCDTCFCISASNRCD